MIIYLHKTSEGKLYYSKYKGFNGNFIFHTTWIVKVNQKNVSKYTWASLLDNDWIKCNDFVLLQS